MYVQAYQVRLFENTEIHKNCEIQNNVLTVILTHFTNNCNHIKGQY